MELLGDGFEGLLLHWVLTYGRMTTSLIDLVKDNVVDVNWELKG